MKVGSLFSGIGGFDLGLERAGMEVIWQVEIDDFCNRVLEKHWPDVRRYRDVREVGKHNLEPVDLICGGFPCQPHSFAGKRRGAADDRNLWPEFKRIIDELRPRWVVAENVPGIRTTMLDQVLFDLEGLGYSNRPVIIPAVAVDAPHRRDRVWIIAHRTDKIMADTGTIRLPNAANQSGNGQGWQDTASIRTRLADGCRWQPEPDVGRVAHGIPDRVDRLKALGNAVVPQVVEFIGRLIMEVERDNPA